MQYCAHVISVDLCYDSSLTLRYVKLSVSEPLINYEVVLLQSCSRDLSHNSMFECCSAKYESYQTDCFDTYLLYKFGCFKEKVWSLLKFWILQRCYFTELPCLQLSTLFFYLSRTDTYP